MNYDLVLASASLRRRAILADMGVAFVAVAPQVEEIHRERDPVGSVRENARRKHDWCRPRYPAHAVLAADTVVDFEGRSIPKPADAEEARRFLRAFAGKAQRVHTGVALSAPGEPPRVEVVTSEVVFRPLTEAVIEQYLAAVDPLDKAGAYDINARGDLIIASYSGSYTNIMGLPRETVEAWLGRATASRAMR